MPGGPHPGQARREVALPDTCLAPRASCVLWLPGTVAGKIPLLQVDMMTMLLLAHLVSRLQQACLHNFLPLHILHIDAVPSQGNNKCRHAHASRFTRMTFPHFQTSALAGVTCR